MEVVEVLEGESMTSANSMTSMTSFLYLLTSSGPGTSASAPA